MIKLIFLPLTIVWTLAMAIIKLTGKLVALILGFLITIIGIVLSLTIIGAIVGIPMILIGIAMIFGSFIL